jgi:glycosyltransferase involved in cell wall biosynthesis
MRDSLGRMRLLYTITAYPPSTGGAQLYLHHLVRHLGRYDATVVSLWDANRSDWLLGTTIRAAHRARDYEIDGVAVHRMGLPLADRMRLLPAVAAYYPAMGWAAPRVAAEWERRIAERVDGADVVHAVRVGREPLTLASADAAAKAGRPFVLTPLHHPRWVGRRYRLYADLYRRADAVVALTESERDVLVRLGVRAERIVVTGMGPVLAPAACADRFRTRHGIDGPLVLFLGQHFPYKGYRALLEAAPLVWQRVPEASIVFAGPAVRGSERSFRGTDRRIHRLGVLDLQAKTDALAACDVLCVPSLQESFGGVFTEAWSFGRPVVGGDIPAVREVVDEGRDGLLVRQDPGEIAEGLTFLLEHPTEARRMGEAGRAKVAERYAWPRLAAKTEEVYRSVA